MGRGWSFALAIAAIAAFAGPAEAEGDAAAGEKVFKKCTQCHEVGSEAKNKIGPELTDVIGRKAGSVEGFDYSPAMKQAGEDGWIWTEENIDKYLENPKEAIPGNKMVFVGLKKPEDRANLIAYLKSVQN